MVVRLTNLGVAYSDNSNQVVPIPQGLIIPWYGASGSVPSGWAICNGTTQDGTTTPDLRDRFIVVAGNSYSPGATGGSASVTLSVPEIPIHWHPMSGTLSASPGAVTHSHNSTMGTGGIHSHAQSPEGNAPFVFQKTPAQSFGIGGGSRGSVPAIPSTANANWPHAHPYNDTPAALPYGGQAYSGVDGNHYHNASCTIANAGGGGSHENRPPYYALFFIKRK